MATGKTCFTLYNDVVQSVSGTISGSNTTFVEPEVVGNTMVLVDGKWIENTATSGTVQYAGGAWPSDYPVDFDERQQKRGTVGPRMPASRVSPRPKIK
jgi:hypothetical protein